MGDSVCRIPRGVHKGAEICLPTWCTWYGMYVAIKSWEECIYLESYFSKQLMDAYIVSRLC